MNRIMLHQCRDSTPAALSHSIEELHKRGAESVMILACDADRWQADEVNAILQSAAIPIFGGIFPSIIVEHQHRDHGTVLVGFKHTLDVVVVENLTTREELLHINVHNQCSRFRQASNLLVLIDGLSPNIERFVASLYTLLGPVPTVVGGGAGSLDFVPKPCLFTNDGLMQDAAVMVSLPLPLHASVEHGWEVLKGPYMVTDAEANVLKSLNYRPAYEIYRAEVESASSHRFNRMNFFDIAKIFPLGVEDLHGKIVVRDPIREKNGELVCVGGVPKNSMIYILKGENDKLINASRRAAAQADTGFRSAGNGPGATAMVLDCISRVLFLDKAYPQALNAMNSAIGERRATFGALTLGEIAGVSHGPINLLNKSTIVSLF